MNHETHNNSPASLFRGRYQNSSKLEASTLIACFALGGVREIWINWGNLSSPGSQMDRLHSRKAPTSSNLGVILYGQGGM